MGYDYAEGIENVPELSKTFGRRDVLPLAALRSQSDDDTGVEGAHDEPGHHVDEQAVHHAVDLVVPEADVGRLTPQNEAASHALHLVGDEQGLQDGVHHTQHEQACRYLWGTAAGSWLAYRAGSAGRHPPHSARAGLPLSVGGSSGIMVSI